MDRPDEAQADVDYRLAVQRDQLPRADRLIVENRRLREALRGVMNVPLDRLGPYIRDALAGPDPEQGVGPTSQTGHRWPCGLFYVGNWRDDEPLVECSCAAVLALKEPDEADPNARSPK